MKIVDFENGCLEEFYKRVSKNVIRIRKQRKISQLNSNSSSESLSNPINNNVTNLQNNAINNS